LAIKLADALYRYNGLSRRRLMVSPAQFLLRATGEFGLLALPLSAGEGLPPCFPFSLAGGLTTPVLTFIEAGFPALK